MTNKEKIDYMNALQAKCENGYEAEAITFAIKAIRIVEVIENGFKRDSNLIIDADDWKDIKAFVEKEADNEKNR